jgi:hypothetical protein
MDELEKDVAELKGDVKDIMENHLPHLGRSMAWIKGALWVLVPVIIAIFGMFIWVLRTVILG